MSWLTPNDEVYLKRMSIMKELRENLRKEIIMGDTMPQVILPNVRDAENPELQVQYLYDAYYKIRKELEYLLQTSIPTT